MGKKKSKPTATLHTMWSKSDVNLKGECSLTGKQRKEIALLLWSIASNIPPNVYNNSVWPQTKKELNISICEVDTLLKYAPVIEGVVLMWQEQQLCSLYSFWTSFDLWTSMAGRKYLVLNYEGITPDPKFEKFSAMLDLIRFYGKAFSTTISTACKLRIDAHTSSKSDIIHAGNFTDSGANVYLAGELLTSEEEQRRCLNHILKNIICGVLGEKNGDLGSSVIASKDMRAMFAIIKFICTSSDLLSIFQKYEEDFMDRILEFVDENDTRWEGKFKTLERFIKVKQPTIATCQDEKIVSSFKAMLLDYGTSIPLDVLTVPYWSRLQSYKEILEVFHKVSKGAQSKALPTGSNVPEWVYQMQNALIRTEIDQAAVSTLKKDLRERLDEELGFVLTTSNIFIKAALFDTRFAGKLPSYGVTQETIDSAWFELEAEGGDEYDVIYGEGSKEILSGMLKVIKSNIIKYPDVTSPFLFWRSPEFGGIAHKGNVVTSVEFVRPLASMFLSVMAGSANSECSFNITGDIITKKRTRTSDEQLQSFTRITDYIRSHPNFQIENLFRDISSKLNQFNL
jgi:hypothetical protein